MQALNKTQKKPGKPTVRSLDEAIMLLATSMADMSKQIKESNARTDRLIAESNARTDRQIAASNARMEKMIAESKDIVDRLSVKVDRLSEDFGCVGNRLGRIVELIVIPGIRKAINKFGHNYTKTTLNRVFYGVGQGGRKEKVAEVDVFLYNGAEAMAAEIKAHLSTEDVTAHLRRLAALRGHEKDTGIQNKELCGAVIGIDIDPHARNFALKKGLYVLDIIEAEKRLSVDEPGRCHVW